MYLYSQPGPAVYGKPVSTMGYAAGTAIRNNISRFETTSAIACVTDSASKACLSVLYFHIQSILPNYRLWPVCDYRHQYIFSLIILLFPRYNLCLLFHLIKQVSTALLLHNVTQSQSSSKRLGVMMLNESYFPYSFIPRFINTPRRNAQSSFHITLKTICCE